MARQRFGILIAAMSCAATVALCGDAAGAVKLALKLDKGKTYYERSLVDQRITQSVMGQDQVINQVIGVGRKLDVLDVDAQANMRIRYTYTWSTFKQSGPMGTTDYDSSNAATAPAGAEGFAAVIGESYVLKVSPKGKILDVNGVEALAEAVRKKAPNADVSTGMSPATFLVNKDAIRESAEGVLAVYPDEPVEVGASWDEKRVANMGLVLITESKSTLQKREGGVATISSVITMKSDPQGPPMSMQGMYMKFEMAGTHEGTTQVDEATGLIKTDRGHSVLKGQIGIGASAEGPFNTMAIPTTFDTTTVTEMSDRMWETPLQQP